MKFSNFECVGLKTWKYYFETSVIWCDSLVKHKNDRFIECIFGHNEIHSQTFSSKITPIYVQVQSFISRLYKIVACL